MRKNVTDYLFALWCSHNKYKQVRVDSTDHTNFDYKGFKYQCPLMYTFYRLDLTWKPAPREILVVCLFMAIVGSAQLCMDKWDHLVVEI